jgi:D-proline reductase (dithiol) PrdB
LNNNDLGQFSKGIRTFQFVDAKTDNSFHRGISDLGDLSEFPLKYRLFLKAYPWRRVDPVPWQPLQKPLKECRLVLVSSSGFTTADQAPFDETILGGDYSFREIQSDVAVDGLIDTHRSDSFDHSGIRQDPNLAFPINRMRELEKKRRIGLLNHRHLSFMGSITAPGRLLKKTLPRALKLLKDDAVDAALLVPV